MRRVFTALLALALALVSNTPSADPVTVRHAEGLVHGFLALRNLDGSPLANGDLIQNVRGDQVTTRMVFQFRDGSVHDETAVFSQRGRFRLLTDHLIQKGPAFKYPLDMTIDQRKGQVVVKYRDDGADKVETERMDLPLDLANGLLITLLKNISKTPLPTKLSYVAATPKPRLVKLVVSRAGTEAFTVGTASRRATHYALKVEIGGITGILADVLDKEPPDSHVWIFEGEAPAFVKSEAALFSGGPLWRMELTSPVWSK
jgi:hypothetical protein